MVQELIGGIIDILSVVYRARDHLRFIYWRWGRNLPDVLAYLRKMPALDRQGADIVSKLRCHGIVCTEKPADPDLFVKMKDEALRLAERALSHRAQEPLANPHDRKADRSALGQEENKNFLQVLTPPCFNCDSAYLRYALQPQFIAIASAYLGLRARLRAVHLWLNYPTEGNAASTQLWHRDGDDFMNLKIFTYLTDVGGKNGPFAFIPGTQPLGRRKIRPEGSAYGRTNDEQMGMVVDCSRWQICIGATGSTIFADTCGFHKGVKPVEGHRLMLMAHYTSSAARSPNELKLNDFQRGAFSEEQLMALGLKLGAR